MIRDKRRLEGARNWHRDAYLRRQVPNVGFQRPQILHSLRCQHNFVRHCGSDYSAQRSIAREDGSSGQTHQPPRGVALKSTARAGKGEPKSHQNACAAFGRPQFRLRIGGTRMFYNISSSTAEVLTIVTKLEAEAWLRQFGHPV
jgi:hypothetical protein